MRAATPATGAGCPKTDQRGVPRPDIAGTPCDIGAFEFVGGQIIGTVTDSRTNATITGICVHAYHRSGGVLASTQTDLSGDYALGGLAAGSVEVEFSSGCGAGNYLSQYYKDPVAVTDGTSTSGIDAAMVGQAQIAGTVTARVSRAPLAGICVRAYNSSGGVAASTKTDSNGSYTIGALPTGSYRVGFVDCSHRGYLSQYYNDKATLASAAPIPLLTAATRSGVNAALVNEGQITGTVIARHSHAPIAGICAKALNGSGHSVAVAATNPRGEYAITGLEPGSYRVKFTSRCGSATEYAAQYYKNQATLARSGSAMAARRPRSTRQ